MWDERKNKAQTFHKWLWTKKKYLEEIMNGRLFKLLHGHIISNSDILIHHCLLEPFLSKTFTCQESQLIALKRSSNRRVQGRACIKERSVGFRSHGQLSGSNMSNGGIKLNNQRLGRGERTKLRLLIASTVGKISSINRLRHSLPLLWWD